MIDDVTAIVILDLQAAYRFNTHDVKLKAGLLEEMSPLLPLEKIEEAMMSGINERSKLVVR